MNLKPIQKTVTLKDQAYHSIKHAIYTNELKPGSPLTEEQLSASLSISRTPIRSALQQLVFDKLAVCDNTGHIFVSQISEKDVVDITTIRVSLEPLALDLASFPVDETILHTLQDIIKSQENLLNDHTSENNILYTELDCKFHSTMAQICDNKLLCETIESINTMMIRVLILSGTLNSYKATALEEHKMIVNYLLQGQKEFAKVALKEHIKCVGDRMLN